MHNTLNTTKEMLAMNCWNAARNWLDRNRSSQSWGVVGWARRS